MAQTLRKGFIGFFLLFLSATLPLAAQEMDLFKDILKESLKPDFLKAALTDVDSIELDSIHSKKIVYFEPDSTLSPWARRYQMAYMFRMYERLLSEKDTMMISIPFTYLKGPAIDKIAGYIDGKPMPDSRAVLVAVDPVVIFSLLMKAGVLSNEPFVPRESRKAKNLRIITQEVYHVP
jgi:hypothetical protein